MDLKITGTSATFAFTAVLVGILIWALASRQRSADTPFVIYAPTLLTTVGILGTFTGVVIGLWNFNVNDIEQSIPGLLDGLKTAFVTSVIGMFFSIIYKVRDVAWPKTLENDENVPDDITPRMVYEQLCRQTGGIEDVSKSISGDDEATLVGQLKLLRADSRDDATRLYKQTEMSQKEFQDFRVDLKEQLESFAKMLSKSATEQVVEALKNVISDFNQNLTEQFGENFKQLNEAVHELVTWQDNYRTQLAEMSEQYSQGVQAITLTETSVAEIGRETKEIPVAMEQLKSVVLAARAQTDELEAHLKAFADMRDKAVEAVPEIKNQMALMAEEVTGATKTASTMILEGCKAANESLITGAEDFNNRVERTNAALTTTSDVISANSESIKDTLDDAAKDLNSNMSDMIAKIAESNERMNQELQATTESVINNIDAASKVFSHNMGESFKEFKHTSEEMLSNFNEQAEGVTKRVEATAQHMSEKQILASDAAFEAIKASIQRSVGDFEQSLNSQIAALDQALETELQRALKSMGNKLGGVTEKFAADYANLTTQMSRVVEQARTFSDRGKV